MQPSPVPITSTSLTMTGLLHSFLQCNKCHTFSCGGILCPNYLKHVNSGLMSSYQRDAQTIAWCCDAGRQFLILAVAFGPTPPSTTINSASKAATKTPSPPKKLTKPPRNDHPVSQLSKGTGYGGPENSGYSLPVPTLSRPPKKPTISKADETLQSYFFALSKLLPSQTDGGATPEFDSKLHAVTAEMLRRSPLLPRASEVLRRGSALDHMGYNHRLYTSLLELLLAIPRQTDVLPVLFQPQVIYPESQQLAAIIFGSEVGTSGPPPCDLDTTKSLDELLQNLVTFCRYYVKQAERCPDELKDTDEMRSLSVAKYLIESMDKLDVPRELATTAKTHERPSATLPAPGQVPNVATRSRAAKTDDDQRRERMAAWHREHCVEEVPDDKIMEGFYFQKYALAALNAQNWAKGRMKSLVTQIACLRTNLPQGIYVRHGISRPDVIKALIVGPEGTPYENGLFEFDMFCDSNFPKQPPKMQFRTTGDGRVGFNPNLYANGKGESRILPTAKAWDAMY